MDRKCKCKRCGYDWESRINPEQVRQCPRCKSPVWNKERQIKFVADKKEVI